MKPRFHFFLLVLVSLVVMCRPSADQNKAEIEGFNVVNLLGGGYFLFDGEFDPALSPNCGVASPAIAGRTGVPGGQPAPAPVAGGNTANNTRFLVVSQLTMKNTREVLSLRFFYDAMQNQGAIDNQQGFILSGGAFGNTVTGINGTVRWLQQGVDVNPNIQTTQTLSFFNIDADLSGTYTPGATVGTNPRTCYTQDNTNCTAITTSTQCFTFNNQTCATTSPNAAGTQSIIIRAKLRCNSPNVMPN